jgi:hypothetical protein
MIAGENDVESVVRADPIEESVSGGDERTERGVLLDEVREVNESIRKFVPLDAADVDHSPQAGVRVSLEMGWYQDGAVPAKLL